MATCRALPEAFCWTAKRHGTPPPPTYSLRTVWPGPFGATMITSTFFGGTICLKWMLNPWLKHRVLPAFRFGAISLA